MEVLDSKESKTKMLTKFVIDYCIDNRYGKGNKKEVMRKSKNRRKERVCF